MFFWFVALAVLTFACGALWAYTAYQKHPVVPTGPEQFGRYVVALPVDTKEGTPFFEVNDLHRDVTLAAIHRDVPGARGMAEAIAKRLNAG